jgi:trehalose 6-phosphate synthase
MTWTREALRRTVQERLQEELFVVVSNREPYIHRFEGEEIVCQVPASGLTIALDPVVRACGGLWVAHGSGDADRQVVDAQDRLQVPPEDPAYTLRRVWLSREEEDGYYNGFANSALWPLCHIAYTRPRFDEHDWQTYRAVNEKFAAAVLEEVGERRAFVFIQDYHFALLSRMLKRPALALFAKLLRRGNLRTAQFWHIPWPNPEAFRICPWAGEILDGLLGNDLLGFHVGYHCQNFLDTVDRSIEALVDRERSQVTRGGMTTLVKPFPISIDFDQQSEAASSPAVEQEMVRLKRQFGLRDQVIGLGVDRIDYTKGIPERLKAVERFLTRHPEFQRKFVFVQVGVPSRVHIPEYQRVNDEIDELVESINWKFHAGRWRPVLYIKQHLPPLTLQAWYRLAQVCLVTSLHDGMNLVAKEYAAARVHEDGVLMLSQFTGAARELAGAEMVNPYAVDEMAEVLFRAITLRPELQQQRMRQLREQLREHNVYRWAGEVLSALFNFEFQEV